MSVRVLRLPGLCNGYRGKLAQKAPAVMLTLRNRGCTAGSVASGPETWGLESRALGVPMTSLRTFGPASSKNRKSVSGAATAMASTLSFGSQTGCGSPSPGP